MVVSSSRSLRLGVFASFIIGLAGPAPVSAVSITVDGTGHNVGPLPEIISAFAVDNGADVLPAGPGNSKFIYSLFDTGAELVAISKPSDATFLGINAPRSVDVRINGVGAVDPVHLLQATLGPPGSPSAAQAEVAGVTVGPRIIDPLPNGWRPTLIGAPVANNVLAAIDYTTSVTRGPYSFGSVTAPDITFFLPGDTGIPTPEVVLDLDRFGSTSPALDGTQRGEHYLLRNVSFDNNGHTADDQNPLDPLNFFFDTGTTPTIISSNMANRLMIDLTTPGAFDCLGGTGNGYAIDSITMTGAGGNYVIGNASVCVSDASITTFIAPGQRVDAVIGSNLFDQVPVLFDGPGNTLGIGIAAAPNGIPEPSTAVLFGVGLATFLLLRRRANQG